MATEPDADGVYRPSQAILRRGVPTDLDAQIALDPEELNSFDKKLIEVAAERNGNISPIDLAAAVGFGISPAKAFSRLREILNNRDLLTVEHKLSLLMEDLVDLKIYVRDKMDQDEGGMEVGERGKAVFSIGDPRWSANMLKVLTAIGVQHDKALARLDKVDVKLSPGHANIVIAALDRVVSSWLFTMVQLYPEIDELVARNAMEDSLERGFSVVDDSTND